MAQWMKHLLCRLENLSQIPSTHVHSQSSPDRTEKNRELRPTSEHTDARAYTCLNVCVCVYFCLYAYILQIICIKDTSAPLEPVFFF